VKCSDFLKELTDYLDNTIDQRTRSELEEHLRWCHNCYVVCNTTKSTIEIYRGSELYELPDELRGRLQAAIISRCKCHQSSTDAAASPTRAMDPGEKSS
jgi:Putative zinc-finger